MSLFEPRIDRDLAVQLGEEAVAISKAGKYVGPSGPVDIAAGVKACVVLVLPIKAMLCRQ